LADGSVLDQDFRFRFKRKGAVMKAVCWMGTSKVETLTVADPTLLNPHDAIIKITKTAICGSDLHLYDGFIPTMEAGDGLGHEFMGFVEEVGKDVANLRRGDRVVVPFTIACGSCLFCKKKLWAACDNTNPNAHLMERRMDIQELAFSVIPI
jgi:threonine dehydrogenase-like Zn-dependent dehydrogenase